MGKISPRENLKENYLIFARKFRPETFDEVVGQDAIVRLLRNAIRTGRIPQGFLFSGPRGVGKTSTARIIAKALNCVKGPTELPCNECEICREISRSISLDVLEIDGASNRGIDEIRSLRETVKFKPAQARFKIYIIDEVHMLTDEAFNALLKTLEEPPEHVKFIFATTQPHKIPLTILSRCQRFHFKRIPPEAIVKQLEAIAKKEGLKAVSKALFLMARISEGSLRDAESLLDQLSVLSEGAIREEDVLFALGLAGDDALFELLEALHKKNAEKVFSLVCSLYESGKDLVQFGRGLYELFRNLLLLQLGAGAEAFIEMSPESRKQLERFRKAFSREELLLILSLFQNLQGDLRRAIVPPRLLLEAALFKVLHLEGLHRVEDLLTQAEGKKEFSSGDRAKEAPPQNPTPEPPGGITLNDVERIWPQVIERVKSKEMSTGLFLAESAPVEVNERGIVLGFPEEFQFHKETVEAAEKKRLIEEVFSELLGQPVRIQFVTTELPSAVPEAGSESPKARAKVPEIVRDALDIFGGKIARGD